MESADWHSAPPNEPNGAKSVSRVFPSELEAMRLRLASGSRHVPRRRAVSVDAALSSQKYRIEIDRAMLRKRSSGITG